MKPKKVAVVTSQSGAALHDILNVSGLRCPSVPIVLVPVAVQGAGAGKEIAEGIRKAGGETDADVIIVARGGGSAEDLWCFNDEAVARAVAGSRIPVVSGVGHEVDTTLCDLAADVRASTPSNAAEIVFPDNRELLARTQLMRSGLVRAGTGGLRQAELKWRESTQRLSALSPGKRITLLMNKKELAEKAAEQKDAKSLLIQSAKNRLREAEHAAARLRGRLEAVSPMAVLERGYAMVYDAEDRIVPRAAEACTFRLPRPGWFRKNDAYVPFSGDRYPSVGCISMTTSPLSQFSPFYAAIFPAVRQEKAVPFRGYVIK